MTQRLYQYLVDYTKHLIQKHVGWEFLRAANVEIGDVVGEVLLLCYEQGLSTDLYDLKKELNAKVIEYVYHIRKSGSLNFDMHITTQFCKKCMEDKPIGAFSIITRQKYGTKEIYYCCKECQAAIMRRYYAKQWNKYNWGESIKRAQKKYYEKVKHTQHFKDVNKNRQKRWRERKEEQKAKELLIEAERMQKETESES